MNSNDTILIVEDEDNLRDLLRMVLEDSGLKVLEAIDGLKAVEIFIAHKDEIVIVLSDLGLPNLGGWDAFLKMREINPKLIGILASGFYDPSLREEIIESGAMEFIQKPYNSAQILAIIRGVLDERK